MNSTDSTDRWETEIDGFINKYWPVLAARVPEGLGFFRVYAGGSADGFCSHELPPQRWIHSRGGVLFACDETVPDHYVAYGVQGRGGSEYLFAFWGEGERRFAFYDQYCVYMSKESASCVRTAERLNETLAHWDRGDALVVFSGPWGWLDPATKDFDHDNEDLPGELGKINRFLVERSKVEIAQRENEERPCDKFERIGTQREGG